MVPTMSEVDYFLSRARHYFQKAEEATDPKLRDGLRAIAVEFSNKAAAAESKRRLQLADDIGGEV